MEESTSVSDVATDAKILLAKRRYLVASRNLILAQQQRNQIAIEEAQMEHEIYQAELNEYPNLETGEDLYNDIIGNADKIDEEIKKIEAALGECTKRYRNQGESAPSKRIRIDAAPRSYPEQLLKNVEVLAKKFETLSNETKGMKEGLAKMEEKMEEKLNEGLKKTEEGLKKTEEGLKKTEEGLKKTEEGLAKMEEKMVERAEETKKSLGKLEQNDEAINKRIQELIDADAEKRTIRISQAKEQQIHQIRANITFSKIEVASPQEAKAIYGWGPSSESDQVEDFLEAFKKSEYYDRNVFSAEITIHSEVNSKAKSIECTFAGVKFSGKAGDLLVEATDGQGLKEVFGSIELKKECPRNENDVAQLPGQLLLELIGTYDHSEYPTFAILTDGLEGYYAEATHNSDNRLVIQWCLTSFASCAGLMKKFLDEKKLLLVSKKQYVVDCESDGAKAFRETLFQKDRFRGVFAKEQAEMEVDEDISDGIVGQDERKQMKKRAQRYHHLESLFSQIPGAKAEFGSVDNIIGVYHGWDLPSVHVGPPHPMYG